MRKQFLENFSAQFPNELNCSSIRINAEQQDNVLPLRKDERFGNQLNCGPKLKKYQQNDIVGFQMSLSIQDHRENLLELMRSKSAKDLKHSRQQKQKLQHSKRQKQHTAYGGSLYNTTSFDELTMNITANTKINNLTNIQNHTDSLESDKTWQKITKTSNEVPPQQKYAINISKYKPNIKIEDHEQKKVPSKFLDGLKCSITEDDKLQKSMQQLSFEQPYFKIGSTSHLNSANKIQPQVNKLFVQDHRRDLKKVTSVDHIKSVDKKLTLRDYMYLSKLSGCKSREKGSFCQQMPQSPHFAKSGASTSRSRKKIISSNADVMQQLKRQVMKNIQLVQNNLNILLQYVGTSQISEQVNQQELMNMYNINRMLKDRIVSGNDELVMMLQSLNKE